MTRPLCFVLMPFGRKPDAAGAIIDFDAVYRELIAPAIADADLDPIRADEEQTGGVIHKSMFERLILCDYAVADMTTANPNVFYELGIRHAVREWSTVLMFCETARLPFDLALDRALPYSLTPAGKPADVAVTRAALAERLRVARDARPDSPVFQLVDDMAPPDIDRTKTDVFRDRVRYSAEQKERIATAREEGVEAVRTIEGELGPVEDAEAGVVIDLFLSYRAVKAWDSMIALVDKMSTPLAQTVMVQEQLGLALNRAGQRKQAERVLRELIKRRGPSSETYGILGRVYKDQWEEARDEGQTHLAAGLLEKAIDAYLKGFEADWRDAYPGVNALTLMEIHEPPDPRRERLLPVVTYAEERRIESGEADYWDYATRLELAVLAVDQPAAERALTDSLAAVREVWEPETTARNLRLIREARERRGDPVAWAAEMEATLVERSKR